LLYKKKLLLTDNTNSESFLAKKYNKLNDLTNPDNLKKTYEFIRSKRLAQPRIIGDRSSMNMNGFMIENSKKSLK
jgi:hypothetical protein